MAYTPPAGNAVNFVFTGAYVPPGGSAVTFIFGAVVPPPPPGATAAPTAARLASRDEEDWVSPVVRRFAPIFQADAPLAPRRRSWAWIVAEDEDATDRFQGHLLQQRREPGTPSGSMVPLDFRVSGLVREALATGTGVVRISGLARETLAAIAGELRIGGLVREVLATSDAQVRISSVVREILFAPVRRRRHLLFASM